MITDEFVAKSNGLLKVLPEVSDNSGRFLMFDDGGVEVEVGELLYGFVRVLKPDNVLSTGVYTGISDAYIAQAIRDNGFGKLEALEIDSFHMNRATDLWTALDLVNYIQPLLMSSLDFEPQHQYDFMFLDSEPMIRFEEMVNFYPYLKAGGYVGIHDLHRHMGQEEIPGHEFAWPWGVMPDKLKGLIKSGALVPFHFSTPRGLTFLYKPDPRDFK